MNYQPFAAVFKNSLQDSVNDQVAVLSFARYTPTSSIRDTYVNIALSEEVGSILTN